MTDRKPDDLYDALCERLADYGEEPPAPLWANIRAQLPPPVAQPQLRRRRRSSVALLLVLLLTVAGTTGLWWRTRHLTGAAGDAHIAATTPAATSATSSAASAVRSQNQAENDQVTASSITTGTTASPKSPSASQSSAITNSDAASVAGTCASTAPAYSPAASGSKLGAPASQGAESLAHIGRAGAPMAVAGETAPAPAGVAASAAATLAKAPPVAARRPAGAVGAGESPSAGARLANGSTSAASASVASASVASASVASVSSAAAGRQGRRFKERGLDTGRATHASKAVAMARTRAAKQVASSSAGGTAQLALSSRIAAKRLMKQDREAGAAAAAAAAAVAAAAAPASAVAAANQVAATQPGLGADGLTATEAATAARPDASLTDQRSSEASLLARSAALQLAAWPALPAPRLVAVAPLLPPVPLGSRWALQVLAGPALTYRQLGGAPSQTTTVPMPLPGPLTSSPSPNYSLSNGTKTDLAQLERPALGGGLQISVRRTLTKHWNLTAGLGYAEYAARLALQQVPPVIPNRTSPDSTATSIHRRDSYRFVTLPVRLGYAWTLSGRWRVGVLAGADAAFYVGGNSTKSSTCACETQSWGPTGSPYRSFSLGTSLGAEIRYRLTERWELVAQPTATYLLTPLIRPTAAYYERHLFGGTALLGVSFDLP